MKRTSTKLADGRELIYFDEQDDVVRNAPDRRELPDRAGGSELRYDAVLDEWVAVAGHRQTRTFLPPTDQCPLCPSRDGRQTEIPASDYDVVAFENRFPSFSEFATATFDAAGHPDEGPFARRPGVGRCEVLCFTSDHNAALATLPPERIRTVLEAWIDRTAELSARPDVEHVFPFENRGEEIGVTLHHPHSQVYAYPYVAPRVRRMLDSASAYHERTGRDLFTDVLDGERTAGVRVIADSTHWTAFVPVAARFPVEVHVYPKRLTPDLTGLTAAERDDFGPLYLRVLRAFDRLFDMPLPYISAWYQAPVREGRDLFALHLELFSIRRAPDKLKYLAGSETAMGAWVNDIAPEQTAARLRALIEEENA